MKKSGLLEQKLLGFEHGLRLKNTQIYSAKMSSFFYSKLKKNIYLAGSGESCSVFCVQATAGSTCDNVTGDCILGCQSGYAGSKCNIQCCANCQDCSLSQGR